MTETPPRRDPPIVRAITRLLACHDFPRHPPLDPMPLFGAWFEDARNSERYDDFNAMTLATASPDARPSARIVLCKSIEPDPPALVFYTNYRSRKGEELEANPHAAAVFFWPHARRQARAEGVIERTSPEESDAYFRTRPLLSRIGSAISPQSQPIDSRERLVADAIALASRAALTSRVRRPEHWGGYRLHIERLELWSAQSGRLHDRLEWTRTRTNSWQIRRLAP